jgi:hypothetical protein
MRDFLRIVMPALLLGAGLAACASALTNRIGAGRHVKPLSRLRRSPSIWGIASLTAASLGKMCARPVCVQF